MRCCVPYCKNDSRQKSKSQGITFHVFPTDADARASWLNALDKVEWEPKEHSAVCSDHFQAEDLYETRSGLRKIRSGAVPVVEMNSTYCQKKASNLKVCRICLATDVKLHLLKRYKLDHAFENLTGLVLSEDDILPRQVCAECARRLLNCDSFRDKGLRSNALMMGVVNKQGRLTLSSIKSIDREANDLSTKLSIKQTNTDHYDLTLTEDDTQTKNTSPFDLEVDVEIKKENSSNEIFLAENDYNDTVKDEEIINNVIPDKNYLNNDNVVSNIDLTQTDNDITQNSTNCDEMDVDFNASDKGFSSDDSLPLEKSRKKKVKTKKKELKKVKEKKVKKPAEPKIDRRRKPFLNDDLNETLFTITDLTFEEQIAEIDKRQESANYKNAVFKCTECYKGFLDEDAYNGHMTRHTDQCGEYRCSICKTHFKHPHALRKHITAHHTQRFSCNQCPYITTHRQTARLHEKWHKGTKYQCPHCQEQFDKFTTYMGHIRIKHPSDFVCQLCGFSFVSQKGIELHKKLKHRLESVEIPPHGPLCELCDVRFVSTDALSQHLRVSARHNTNDKDARESNKPKKGRKTHEDRERERRLREKNCKDLGDDRRVYPSQMRKAEGPIPCEQCGMQLEDSRAYHGHFRRAHPDKNRTKYPSMKSPCMCEVCGRMFQSYALLKDHTWTHTSERPFKCDSCGKSFRMKQRLVAHRRVHSQVKASYGCSLCGKQFSTHSNRQRHMFIHTGLKPFKCEMCGKCFKHASEKRAHITYVHLKKPWPKRSRGKRRDGRQGSLPPQSAPSDMNMGQPIWPCDPKMPHMPPIMEDKPLYYNLKI